LFSFRDFCFLFLTQEARITASSIGISLINFSLSLESLLLEFFLRKSKLLLDKILNSTIVEEVSLDFSLLDGGRDGSTDNTEDEDSDGEEVLEVSEVGELIRLSVGHLGVGGGRSDDGDVVAVGDDGDASQDPEDVVPGTDAGGGAGDGALEFVDELVRVDADFNQVVEEGGDTGPGEDGGEHHHVTVLDGDLEVVSRSGGVTTLLSLLPEFNTLFFTFVGGGLDLSVGVVASLAALTRAAAAEVGAETRKEAAESIRALLEGGHDLGNEEFSDVTDEGHDNLLGGHLSAKLINTNLIRHFGPDGDGEDGEVGGDKVEGERLEDEFVFVFLIGSAVFEVIEDISEDGSELGEDDGSDG